ncbi:MAG: aminotransferase class V-fold PLP-dependent enzyme [Inquilinus sp.]|nr:aminotransferase class V-fold PLP-dependent enzyme [Inquilinus sp.]
MNLKAHFSRFLAADPKRAHFTAHSHHLWPDVTLAAQQRCWEDAARLADRKWELVFGELIPSLQRKIADIIGVDDPDGIAFGPNTHGFVTRLLSCLPAGRPIRVLTTDSEFHSFTRQIARLEEEGLAVVERVPARPFGTFTLRFAEAAAAGGHDLVFFSQVFYNSGYVVRDLPAIVRVVPDPATLVAIDGYHGFFGVPTDLSRIAERAFYLAGGYKYAMAGEGACFLYAPTGQCPRPRDTGWRAAFPALERADGGVPFAADGSRFLGATFDPVGLYRMHAVIDLLRTEGLSVADIRAHGHKLQRRFVAGLERLKLPALDPARLLVPIAEPNRGQFLTFEMAEAGAVYERLLAANIVTDYRGDRLRFGFGLYQDAGDVDRLLERLPAVLG